MAVEPCQRAKMLLIGESRHAIIRLRIEMRVLQPILGEDAEQRQRRAPPRSRRQRAGELLHQRGDEHGFARARQARHAEPQASAGKILREAFGGDPRFKQKIG